MIEWNKVHYCDCMDSEIGLPSLPDKSVDLCLTDPPYNIDFKSMPNLHSKRVYYDDKMNPFVYKNWCKKWFQELRRICNSIVFTPGLTNLQSWFRFYEFGLVIWHNPNKQGGCKAAKLAKFEPILTYNLDPSNKFSLGHFTITPDQKMGFFQNIDYWPVIHPAAKPIKLYLHILNELKPTSMIDPFLGSGTAAKAANVLGIPWLGYEINPVYKQDIDKRFAQKQIDLWNY